MFGRLVWQLSVRNILRHKRRNGMLLAAIVVAVAGVTGINTLLRGMQIQMLDSAVENLTGHVKLHAPGYLDDPSIENGFQLEPEFVPEIPKAKMVGWAQRIRIPAVVMSERETRGVQLVGVDPTHENISFLGEVSISGDPLVDTDDGRILLGAELARQLETQIGRRVVVITQGEDGKNREKGYRLVGTYDADGTGLEKTFAFTGLANLQGLLDSEKVTEVSVRLREDGDRSVIKSSLAELFNDLSAFDWQDLNPQAASMYLMADTALYIWFLLMMGALAFGLVNTLATSVMERIRELGMLRALGMQKRLVVSQVVLESSLIMTLGVVLGLGLGYLVYLSMGDGIDLTNFSEGMEMAGMASRLTPVFWMRDFVEVALMSIGLGVLASIYPARQAVKVQPLEALRS